VADTEGKRNAYRVLINKRNLKERDDVEDLCINRRVIKWILKR
jgi:hypothetical protein